MSKEIIIDGVNVAECEHRSDTHNNLLADGTIKKFSNYCYITNDGCYGVNCYYKQLKRAEIEIEKLKGVDGSVHPDSAYYKITRLEQELKEKDNFLKWLITQQYYIIPKNLKQKIKEILKDV